MSKIKIENFGPIKGGYIENDGWFDISKVTVFIGNQGSGKSTVAKIISTLKWIEKALIRGDFKEEDLLNKKSFINHCSYQNIQNYFKDNTRINYKGKAYSIEYNSNEIKVHKTIDEYTNYSFPKIMYVPSERNFVSSVKNVRNLKGLPKTLYTFSDEFLDAMQNLDGPIHLPVNNAEFEYQEINSTSRIIGDDYKISLSESSSGFQSFVPLFIVTRYLANSLDKDSNSNVKNISIEEEKRIQKEIEEIYSNPKLTDEVKKAALERLSSRFKYSCFINIVEEPEQNLYPTSQRHVLHFLLKYVNQAIDNVLIITTHSPYIINYLTLVVKAYKVYQKFENAGLDSNSSVLSKINEIVPKSSTLNSNDLIIYELDEKNGSIKKLPDYKGLPSDENKLNNKLEDSNELFIALQEIERGWQ